MSIAWVLMTCFIELPAVINQTYINQASYWLTFFPYAFSFLYDPKRY
jgi:hypothetical protein